MSDSIITRKQVDEWFIDLDDAIKDKIVTTGLGQGNQREEFYHLYQAVQLLRSRFLQDFYSEVTMPDRSYDPED